MTFTIYPAVDIRDGRAVRLTQGRADQETIYDADPVAAATRWVEGGAQWLHVVDLDAAFTGTPRNRHLIHDIVDATGVHVQASGGIRSMADLNASIDYGASRVVIGTMALEEPSFVAAAVAAHGEKIAVGLDADGETLKARGWVQESGNVFEALHRFTLMGVSRFVFTDISRDGTLGGPNVERLRAVAEATTAAVTASGGVGSLSDIEVLTRVHPQVDGAIVGTALYEQRFSVAQAMEVGAGGTPPGSTPPGSTPPGSTSPGSTSPGETS